ncbi:hypothetical protein HMPREF1214_04313 [Bacteroides sp. HPS0048]|nr:hypothetical protein HMPREF1214_04313 [Bacteroides sp. HPS0048]
MTKVHLLGANKSYDRSVQTVSVNQVVVLEGYSYDNYVVYEVTRDKWGITYHLVNLRTHEFHTSDLIRPLSEKFGIGIYYDDANPRFLDPLETAALLTKAKEKKAEEEKKAKEVREEYERIAKIGTERLRPLVPTDAKAVIIGTLRVNECDSYTDYYDYSIGKSSVRCPLKPKRFYPLKIFNNAPSKSLDRWGYYYFSLFPSVCRHLPDTFSV